MRSHSTHYSSTTTQLIRICLSSSSSSSSSSLMAAPPPSDTIVPSSPSDSVTSVHFTPIASAASPDYLVSTSWDSSICVWEVNSNGESIPRARQVAAAPVLCSAWSADCTRVAFAGCEGKVQQWNIQASEVRTIGQHEAPIRCILEANPANSQSASVVTGSWDKTIKYWCATNTHSHRSQHSLLLSALAARHCLTLLLFIVLLYVSFVSLYQGSSRCYCYCCSVVRLLARESLRRGCTRQCSHRCDR